VHSYIAVLDLPSDLVEYIAVVNSVVHTVGVKSAPLGSVFFVRVGSPFFQGVVEARYSYVTQNASVCGSRGGKFRQGVIKP